MAGYSVTSTDVQYAAGNIANRIRVDLRDAMQLKAWLDGQTDSALTSLGLSAEDVAKIKSAYQGDALAINSSFASNQAFLKQLWGMGV